MKKLIELSLILSTCVILSACSAEANQPSATPVGEQVTTPTALLLNTATPLAPTTTPFPTFPAHLPKRTILNYSFGGGHDAFDIVLGLTYSKVVLYSDGQIVISGNPYRQKQLSNKEINWLFSQLESLEFFNIETNQHHDPTDPLYDFGDQYQKTYDDTYICVSIDYTQTRKLCTYEDYKDFLKTSMVKILEFMDNYEPSNMSLYQPDRILLRIEPGRTITTSAKVTQAFWPANFPTLNTDHWKFVEIDGKKATEIFKFFDYSQGYKFVNENGNDFTVFERPLLPHEQPSWP